MAILFRDGPLPGFSAVVDAECRRGRGAVELASPEFLSRGIVEKALDVEPGTPVRERLVDLVSSTVCARWHGDNVDVVSVTILVLDRLPSTAPASP